MSGNARLSAFAALATALAALTLGRVYSEGTWVWPVAGAIATVGAAGWLARHVRVPRLLQPAVTLAALGCFLTFAYASGAAPLVVLPGRDAIEALLALTRAGLDDVQRYAAPVPGLRDLTFLATAGIGLVAVLVDLVAVTLRRPAVAGLPLLAIYCVPATVTDGVGWGAFALGGAGWLALLVADSRERVTRWGRTAGFSDRDVERGRVRDVETSPLAALGRRIGAAALGIAVVLPALWPGLDDGVFGFGSGGGLGFGGGGHTTVTVLNPIADLKTNLGDTPRFEVLRYSTDDRSGVYLRQTTLDVFDGQTWSPGRQTFSPKNRSDDLPAPTGLGPAVPRTTRQIDVRVGTRLGGAYVPLPYPVESVRIDGDFRWDPATLDVRSPKRDGSIRGRRYTARYLDVRPDAAALDGAGAPPEQLRRYLDLPSGIPPVVRRTALSVTAGASTPYAKALALQQWFRTGGGFVYDINPSGNGINNIVEFLQEKRGYCEQFAATMGVMARQLGIPTRLSAGWTPGTPSADRREWSVTTKDAHLWPELYFAGVGWIRFEPTPTGDGRTSDPPWTVTGPALPGGHGGAATPSPTASASPTASLSAEELRRRGDIEGRRSTVGPTGGGTAPGGEVPVLPVSLAAAALLLAASPAMLRGAIRRRRRRAPAGPAATLAAWDELRDTAVDLGYDWSASETPRQSAARLTRCADLGDGSAAALGVLARAVERARYARDPGGQDDLGGTLDAVRRGMAADAGRWRRMRALVLPRSTRRALHAASERVADGLDLVDRAGSRLRARLTPRSAR